MSDEFKQSGSSPDAERPIAQIPLSPELIQDLPDEIRGKLIEEIAEYSVRLELSSGPLPSGRQLAELEQAVPGAGTIVVNNFQQQENHRIRVENRGQIAFIARDVLALCFAFVLALAWLLICREAILAGYSNQGIFAMGVELAAIIGTLVYRDQTKRKERRDQQKSQNRARSEP